MITQIIPKQFFCATDVCAIEKLIPRPLRCVLGVLTESILRRRQITQKTFCENALCNRCHRLMCNLEILPGFSKKKTPPPSLSDRTAPSPSPRGKNKNIRNFDQVKICVCVCHLAAQNRESRIARFPELRAWNRQKFRSEKQKNEPNRSKVKSRKIDSESQSESHPSPDTVLWTLFWYCFRV